MKYKYKLASKFIHKTHKESKHVHRLTLQRPRNRHEEYINIHTRQQVGAHGSFYTYDCTRSQPVKEFGKDIAQYIRAKLQECRK